MQSRGGDPPCFRPLRHPGYGGKGFSIVLSAEGVGKGRAMKPSRDAAKVAEEARRISKGVAFCVSTVVGKYTAYPQVDERTFERIHKRIASGFSDFDSRSIGDFCQELRAMVSCPSSELLQPERVVDKNGEAQRLDEVELRLISIADVVRRGARLSHREFKEILVGLLSWDVKDRRVILDTLVSIIRGS